MKVALSEFAAGVVTVEQMPGLPVGWEEGREGGRGGGRRSPADDLCVSVRVKWWEWTIQARDGWMYCSRNVIAIYLLRYSFKVQGKQACVSHYHLLLSSPLP